MEPEINQHILSNEKQKAECETKHKTRANTEQQTHTNIFWDKTLNNKKKEIKNKTETKFSKAVWWTQNEVKTRKKTKICDQLLGSY